MSYSPRASVGIEYRRRAECTMQERIRGADVPERRPRAGVGRSSCLHPPGFTLIELLVVVAIIALLISILLPSLFAARESAKFVRCAANLHDIGLGIHTYAQENAGFLPRGPDPANPYDFSSNVMATNQLWAGDGTPQFPTAHPRTYFGQGLLLHTSTPNPDVFFCPSDGNYNQGSQIPRIGGPEHAYGSYMYRELDQLPPAAARGLLDNLGSNVVDEVPVRVEMLLMDTNSLGPGAYYHANHDAKRVNVLYRDGSALAFSNVDDALAIPAAAFANPAALPQAIDQLLTNADYAYQGGAPQEAPRIVTGQ